MELKTLKNFLKIAALENITKAADELHMAQPPLTRQLKSLEKELNVPLFKREKKRIHITTEGIFFKQQCEQIINLIEKSIQQVKQIKYGINGTVFIGAIETAGTLFLPKWLAGFKENYPNVKYNLWSSNSADVIERLDRGLLDIALVREPFDLEKYHSIHIKDEPWIVLLPKMHKLTPKKMITLKDLSSEQLIVPIARSKEIQNWFTKRGLKSNIVCEFAPLMNAVILTEKNIGIAICPESSGLAIQNHNVVMREFENAAKISKLSIIWRKGIELSVIEKTFIEYVKEIIINEHPKNTRKS